MGRAFVSGRCVAMMGQDRTPSLWIGVRGRFMNWRHVRVNTGNRDSSESWTRRSPSRLHLRIALLQCDGPMRLIPVGVYAWI